MSKDLSLAKKFLTRRTLLKGMGVAAAAATFNVRSVIGDESSDLVIGAVVPLTGDLRSFGPRFTTAAEIAVNEVNNGPGVTIDGQRCDIKLDIRDSGTNDAVGVAAASSLVDVEGVQCLFGAAASGVSIPIATSVTIPSQVVQISPSATSPEITNLADDDYFFRTAPSDELQGVVLANLAFNIQGYRDIAIIARNDSYGAGLAEVLRREFTAFGGNVSNVSTYDPATTDFSAEIAAAQASTAEAISLITFDEGEALVAQMVAAGVTNFDLFVDGNKNQDLIDRIAGAIGNDLLEGKVGTGPSQAPTLGGDTFETLYREALNEAPFVFTPHSYDALAILCLAAQAAGANDGTAIRDNMRVVANPDGEVFTVGQLGDALEHLAGGGSVNYEGATGAVDFDANGEPISPIGLWTIQGGQIVDTAISECALNADGGFDCSETEL